MDRRKFLFTGAGLSVVALGLVVGGRVLGDEDPPETPLVQSALWGAYAATEPFPDCVPHYELERTLGLRLPTMSWFVNFSNDFPAAAADAKARGYELLIALMPILNGGEPVRFADIIAGNWDSHLTDFFLAAKAYDHPVTVRFAHEMNLGQHVWSVGQGGSTSTDEFIAGWRHVYDLQKSVCGNDSDVHMLWCISNVDGPVRADAYFPGADFVDKVGFDAFSGFTSDGWTEPGDLLGPPVERLAQLAVGKQIWVCELGCRETTAGESHSKKQWLEDLFGLTGFDRLTRVIWFNSNKEQDWRLTSSPAVTAAAQQGLSGRAG